MDRTAFVNAMLAELEQQNTGPLGMNSVPDMLPKEVSNKLNFDFPLLTSTDVDILTGELAKPLNADADDANYPLTLTKKVLDNVVYLTQSRQVAEDTTFAKALSNMTAALYLSTPSKLISLKRSALSTIFQSHMMPGLDNDDDDFDMGGLGGSGRREMAWNEVLEHFCNLLCSSSASHICGLLPNDDVWCGDMLSKARHMENLCSILNLMGDVMSLTAQGKPQDSESILEAFYTTDNVNERTFSFIEMLKKRAMQVKQTISEEPGEGGERASQDSFFVNQIQKMWLHLAYLARDLLSQCPQLLGEHLEAVLMGTSRLSLASASTSTSSIGSSNSGGNGSFPSSSECLQSLICANLAVALSLPSPRAVRTKAESRESFRNIIRGNSATAEAVTLECLVDIFRHMGKFSIDGGAEACSLLLDLCSIYIDGKDQRGVSAKMQTQLDSMHSDLLSSRALVTLVDFFGAFTTSDDATTSASACTEKRQVTMRLVEFFGIACLQGPQMLGSFILRLPPFMPGIRSMLSSWNNSSSCSTGQNSSEVVDLNSHASPVASIPLLLALVLAGSKQQGGNSFFEASSELTAAFILSIEMTTERIRVTTKAMKARQIEVETEEIEEKESGEDDGEEEDKALAELKSSRRAKAVQVPGLVSTLGILVSREDGGYSAIVKAKEAPVLAEALNQLSKAVNGCGTKNDELRRHGKDLQALLEGRGSGKTD
jgi:hypothetical protein